MMLMLPFCTILLLLLTVVAHAQEHGTSPEVKRLTEWLKSKGGILDPRVEIRRMNPQDPSSYFGVFANVPIRQGEVILRVPDALKIKIQDDGDGDDWAFSEMICELSWRLHDEYKKGHHSKYRPYIEYLKTQARGQIPAAWSDAGKELLVKVQGDLSTVGPDDDEEEEEEGNSEDEEEEVDEYMVNWLEEYAEELCADGEDTMDPHFIALAVQRGYDSVMIPVYDMINHSNDPLVINTIAKPPSYDDDEDHIVYALRDIQAGEELFYSYDRCPGCVESLEYWGTPELLRDFGFMEGYPHMFHLSKTMTIIVEEVKTEDGKLAHVATCKDDNCPEKGWIENKVQRLIQVEKLISEASSTVPEHELAIIKDFHKALFVAFTSIWASCPEPSMAETMA